MRRLRVTLISDELEREVVFGDAAAVMRERGEDYGSAPPDDVSISISGSKYLTAQKDEFTIKISNIPTVAGGEGDAPLSVICSIEKPYRYAAVYAGYGDQMMRVFLGYIVTATSKRSGNGVTNELILVCSANATYGNLTGRSFTLKKGTSVYQALTFAAKMTKVQPISIDRSLKHNFLKSDTSFDGTIFSMLVALQNRDYEILCHTDFSSGVKVKVWKGRTTASRKYALDRQSVLIVGGYPNIEDQGVVLTTLPIFNYIPGDEITIDASLFDIPIESLSSYESSPQPYHYLGELTLDEETGAYYGTFLIYELRYALQNRGGDFSVEIKGYAKSLYSAITQGKTDV